MSDTPYIILTAEHENPDLRCALMTCQRLSEKKYKLLSAELGINEYTKEGEFVITNDLHLKNIGAPIVIKKITFDPAEIAVLENTFGFSYTLGHVNLVNELVRTCRMLRDRYDEDS